MNLLSNKGIARGEIFTKNVKDGTYKIKQYHGRGPKWVKAKVVKLHYSSKFTKIMKKASPKKAIMKKTNILPIKSITIPSIEYEVEYEAPEQSTNLRKKFTSENIRKAKIF